MAGLSRTIWERLLGTFTDVIDELMSLPLSDTIPRKNHRPSINIARYVIYVFSWVECSQFGSESSMKFHQKSIHFLEIFLTARLPEQELSSFRDRRPCQSRVGRKVGAALSLSVGELGLHLTQCRLGEAYRRTKWHLDPSSRLDTTLGRKSSRLSTMDMGRKVGGCCAHFWGVEYLSNTCVLAVSSSVRSTTLAIWE